MCSAATNLRRLCALDRQCTRLAAGVRTPTGRRVLWPRPSNAQWAVSLCPPSTRLLSGKCFAADAMVSGAFGRERGEVAVADQAPPRVLTCLEVVFKQRYSDPAVRSVGDFGRTRVLEFSLAPRLISLAKRWAITANDSWMSKAVLAPRVGR